MEQTALELIELGAVFFGLGLLGHLAGRIGLSTVQLYLLGGADDLLAGGRVASRVNWLTDVPAGPVDCTAKIRYRHPGAAATVTTFSAMLIRASTSGRPIPRRTT